MKQLTLILFITVFITNIGFSKTKIISTPKYVYYKTPYKELVAEERREIINETIVVLTDWLAQKLPESRLTETTLDTLIEINTEVDTLLGKIDDYINKSSDRGGLNSYSLVPTAFSIYFGGGLSASYGIGGGGDFSIGFIFLPFKVKRVDKLTKEVDTYIELKSSVVGIPQLKVGGGAGGGGKFGAGLGLIWGPMDSPSDYIGPFVCLEKTLGAGVGISTKVGTLHQIKRPGYFQNPFISAGVISGLNVEAGIMFGGAWIMDGAGILKAMGIDGVPDFKIPK